MLDVMDVARYIINYSNEKDYPISNLRLQKLLYFVQACYLALTTDKKPCFEEDIEAWDFGPVVPRVYHEFKMYGGGSIPSETVSLSRDTVNFWKLETRVFDESAIPEKDRKIIGKVIDKFKDHSTTYLVSLSHHQDPWKNAYRNRKRIITQESIKEYFKKNA